MEASRNAPRKALKTNTTATAVHVCPFGTAHNPRGSWEMADEIALEGAPKGQTRAAKKAYDPPLGRFAHPRPELWKNGHRRVSTPPPGPDGRVLGKALDEPTRISPGTENLQMPSNDHLELRATSEAGETRIEMTDGYSTPLSGSSLPLRPLHAHPFISALFPKSNSDRGVQG